MSTTRITLVGEFEFRRVDEAGEVVASTTVVGPRELGLEWAVEQTTNHPRAALQRRLLGGTWVDVSR